MNGRTQDARDIEYDEEPPIAAHLVTPRTLYTHHGIYVGNGRVVHYAGFAYGLRRGPVEQVSLERFAHGRAVQVRPDQRRYDRCEVVERALSRLGESHYRILTNNCEHFCGWALRGECFSAQVERIRAAPQFACRTLGLFFRRIAQALGGATAAIHFSPHPPNKESAMHTSMKILVAVTSFAVMAAVMSFDADSAEKQDKYTLKVPGGLSFSEFKGFESWQAVSVSRTEKALAVILANPAMIAAYQAGIPANGKPVPDGAKMAKIHWNPKTHQYFPDNTVPGTQRDVDFMVKDSKRFPDSGGWGYAVFRYDAATDSFRAGTLAETPAQANDAKCGFACHTVVKSRDFVFTEYAHR